MIKTCQEGYDLIRNGINSDEPFFVGRSGSTEARVCSAFIDNVDYLMANKDSRGWYDQVAGIAGIYPYTRESLENFVKEYIASCSQMQVVGSWLGKHEDLLMNPKADKVPLRALDVINENPWTTALEGKRVVVVHPFLSTINYQYARRETWDHANWCPKFGELSIVQTRFNEQLQNGGYTSWEDELERIKKNLNFDYDVALIGCGCLGAMVGAHVFQSGKKAIHMGGCLQLLFGIRGSRWEGIPEYAALMNDDWARPFPDDRSDTIPEFAPHDKNAYT